MSDTSKATLQAASPYNAAITREQFLFYEVRITAKLLHEGCSADILFSGTPLLSLPQFRRLLIWITAKQN